MAGDTNLRGAGHRSEPRPIAAGLLVALIAPLLALCPLLTLFVLVNDEVIFGDFTVTSALLPAYFGGGVQSITGGTLVSLAMQTGGWISAQRWVAYTVALGLAPGALLLLMAIAHPSREETTGWPYVIIALSFLTATLLASLFLRVLIIGIGWMRKQ